MDDRAKQPRARRAGFARSLHSGRADELTAADLRALRELLRSEDAPTVEIRGLARELRRAEVARSRTARAELKRASRAATAAAGAAPDPAAPGAAAAVPPVVAATATRSGDVADADALPDDRVHDFADEPTESLEVGADRVPHGPDADSSVDDAAADEWDDDPADEWDDDLDVGDQHGDDRAGTRRELARRVAIGAGRGLAGLLSFALLAGTGVGWAGLTSLQNGLNTTDVIAVPPGGVPDGPPADGATDILLVGADSRTDAQGHPLPLDVLKLLRTEGQQGINTDTIILIRVPNGGGNAFAVSIPRDTYISIPGYRDDKINAAYGHRKDVALEQLRASGVTDEPQLDRESSAAGQRALIEVVQNLTGVTVDHYAEVNLYGFYLLTEAIGGVEVCLKRATRDPDSGADFDRGRQFVSGGDALAFVRQRKNLPRGDLDRIVRQQVFMAALASRMLAAGTLADPAKLRGLMDAAEKSIVLDEGWDVLQFAGQMQGIAGGDVQFVTIPVVQIDAWNERGQSIVTVDRAEVAAFVAGLVAGGPATPTVAPPVAPTATPASPAPTATESFVVSVRNGSNRSGLASRVSEVLAAKGFNIGQLDNASPRERTEIRVGPGATALGEQISAALGGVPVVEDAAVAADRPRVILGADYTGPGTVQRLGGDPLVRLDGAAFAAQAQPSPDDDAPITAEGITCVN